LLNSSSLLSSRFTENIIGWCQFRDFILERHRLRQPVRQLPPGHSQCPKPRSLAHHRYRVTTPDTGPRCQHPAAGQSAHLPHLHLSTNHRWAWKRNLGHDSNLHRKRISEMMELRKFSWRRQSVWNLKEKVGAGP